MEQTLRDRIESMLKRLEDRCTQLDEYIIQYSNEGNYVNAGINQLKKETFEFIAKDLRLQLNS